VAKATKSSGFKNVDTTKKTPKKTIKKIKKKTKLAPIVEQPKIQVKQYIHEKERRANNPPVGLVTPESDMDLPPKNYSFDPHLDPQLQWTGKKENSDFEVDTVSLHRHEKIDPITIISKLLKKYDFEQQTLFPFFEDPENNLPLRDAIEFYKHDQNWSNRLIAGDSLLVMNSLLEKEGMEGKVQMIYIDPPYGITYKSNFQPFVNQRDVKDRDEDLNQEPETIKAFRDTWELGIHSYLNYLRNRILLAKSLLKDEGSLFVQIGEENLHLIRNILDEIFGSENFCTTIIFRKTTGESTNLLSKTTDYLLWYAKDKSKIKFHQLYLEKKIGEDGAKEYKSVELENGEIRPIKDEEILNPKLLPENAKIFSTSSILSPGYSETNSQPIHLEYNNEKFTLTCPPTRHWSLGTEGVKQLWDKGRLLRREGQRIYKKYLSDFPYSSISALWTDTRGDLGMKYVVQTSSKVIMRCILMTTDPGDLVFDPTCGGGTTAFAAENLGRRWITCDTSRIAIALTKQRLMTSSYEYYKLKFPNEGIDSGFVYEQVENKIPSSVARDIPGNKIDLFDKIKTDKEKIRITGPFTVEAVPSPIVKSLDTEFQKNQEIDSSISRTTGNRRQQEWRDELLNTGVRGKGGQKIEFSRVEIHSVSQWIHAIAETKESKPKTVAVSFGPEYSPLEQRQVSLAITEAQKLVPTPELIIFASLQFDPEAAKDIDETQWKGVQLLKVQVNADLLTTDLKKKRVSNESFWLMGQPDIELMKQKDGKYIVEVRGFDYYNTKTGELMSGDSSKISMWMLDTDYDERSVYPQQMFFPMSGKSEGWSKLAKILKSEINESFVEHYTGTKSLPFSAGSNKQIAVKIVDDRGIESLRIIKIE
jgi:adenine-specific DNA-methyltransferase